MILNLYAPAPQSTHMSMTIISFNIFSLMMMILFSQWHRLQLNTEFLFQESNLWPSRNYSGGQKCWDLSINTSKNSDLLPPSSKNVKCWAKWAEINSFLGATLLVGGGGGGGGGWRDEPEVDEKKIVTKRTLLCNNYLGVFFYNVPIWFDLHCSLA